VASELGQTEQPLCTIESKTSHNADAQTRNCHHDPKLNNKEQHYCTKQPIKQANATSNVSVNCGQRGMFLGSVLTNHA